MPTQERQGRPLAIRRCLTYVALFLIAPGCQSTHFDAESLPQELLAQSTGNPRTVDLSKLAGSSVSSELISPGDVLEVTIAAGLSESQTITFPARVNDSGSAGLPVIGSVQVADLELEGAEAAIRSACVQKGLYRAPHVTVTMKRQRLNRITVVGAVRKPGVYHLPRKSSNLLAAIVSAEGLATDAGENVEIRMPNATPMPTRRGDRIASLGGQSVAQAGMSIDATPTSSMKSIQVNLVSAAKQGTGGYQLPDGGVVMVERRDPVPVQVLGLVNEQGAYEFPVGKDFYLLDAVANAGGLSTTIADKIFVIRQVQGKPDPAVIKVSYRKAKESHKSNLLLQPGDVVSVEQTPATILLDTIKLMNFGVGASARIF